MGNQRLRYPPISQGTSPACLRPAWLAFILIYRKPGRLMAVAVGIPLPYRSLLAIFIHQTRNRDHNVYASEEGWVDCRRPVGR